MENDGHVFAPLVVVAVVVVAVFAIVDDELVNVNENIKVDFESWRSKSKE